ncbi:substrate-binding domain-containing protein [bacterium]|nr:substrate-binding domain-containing protein [bacterium]
MNRIVRNFLLVALLSTAIWSCGPRAPRESYTVGTALIGSSDAVFDLAASLVQDYQSQYSTAFVSVYRHETRALIDTLISERAEEIFIDRSLTPAETLAFARQGLKLYTYGICYYPVYFMVDTVMGIAEIDSARLRGILTGQITNWKEVGGRDQLITPFLPLPGTGAWATITDYFGELDSLVAVPCSTDTRMLELARDDPGAFLVYSHPSEELHRYRRLRWSVDELRIPANVKRILESPIYPFMMEFTYATTRNKGDVAAGFLTFMMATNGQRFLMERGYRPAVAPVRVIHSK